MEKAKRKHAPAPIYISPKQLSLEAFKSPFERELNPRNRWVVLAGLIPWDEICSLYLKNVTVSNTGRPPLNPRIVIGSLIIKHMVSIPPATGSISLHKFRSTQMPFVSMVDLRFDKILFDRFPVAREQFA